MTPNAANYNPAHEYALQLIERITSTGKSQKWIADRLGVTDRRIRYIVAGRRIVNGAPQDVRLSYCEQFALECLIAAIEAAQQL
ncbi:hypothetical protein DK842_17985 [Chromobacterium phragmitis]|uniref:hypothetical protein n=1 Tax=Chromobacterium phragmitis TaxID=2202141 RepID=UPI000DED2CE0|nr:hypothetical protein [Chromobacterium phragmitis]AXE31622.1 hypothetical protein DK842_17985 [Chromobacterium phragmitis]